MDFRCFSVQWECSFHLASIWIYCQSIAFYFWDFGIFAFVEVHHCTASNIDSNWGLYSLFVHTTRTATLPGKCIWSLFTRNWVRTSTEYYTLLLETRKGHKEMQSKKSAGSSWEFLESVIETRNKRRRLSPWVRLGSFAKVCSDFSAVGWRSEKSPSQTRGHVLGRP